MAYTKGISAASSEDLFLVNWERGGKLNLLLACLQFYLKIAYQESLPLRLLSGVGRTGFSAVSDGALKITIIHLCDDESF